MLTTSVHARLANGRNLDQEGYVPGHREGVTLRGCESRRRSRHVPRSARQCRRLSEAAVRELVAKDRSCAVEVAFGEPVDASNGREVWDGLKVPRQNVFTHRPLPIEVVQRVSLVQLGISKYS